MEREPGLYLIQSTYILPHLEPYGPSLTIRPTWKSPCGAINSCVVFGQFYRQYEAEFLYSIPNGPIIDVTIHYFWR